MNGAWPAHEGQGRQRSDVRAGEVPTARDARSRTSGLPCSGDNGSHCAAQTIFVPDAMKRGSKRDTSGTRGSNVRKPHQRRPVERSANRTRARICDAQVHSILLRAPSCG